MFGKASTFKKHDFRYVSEGFDLKKHDFRHVSEGFDLKKHDFRHVSEGFDPYSRSIPSIVNRT